MYVKLTKRYPGNRYEYLLSVSYPIEKASPRINQDRKLDIFALFKKGNQAIADKNNNQSLVGPLFCQLNMPSQWFWSKKSARIIENNTHMSDDHIINLLSYITPLPFAAHLYAEFDTRDNHTYKICTLGDCKLYRETQEESSAKQLLSVNPYASYYLFKLPPGKRLVFSINTEFSTPYIYKNEYDLDAQNEIKEIILFDVVDRTLLSWNPEQTFLYTNTDIDKRSVTNTFTKMSNTCAKFRRPHILPLLPSYEQAPHIYTYMQISRDTYDRYHARVRDEDELAIADHDKHITVAFSLIGSSTYTIKFMHDAFLNLRRNLAHFTFRDKQFISDVINEIINKLATFKHNA